ncbi:MAG: ABC transporter permease [Verrucomicrobia bacterium Tous-C9LFEB]|nr:MAG: ABC transporter permease [Verrucomicrobia bacterium Tous-C9LFEB]
MTSDLLHQILRRRAGAFCLVALILFYVAAFFAPLLAPYATSDQDLTKTYHPPTGVVWHEGQLAVRLYKLVDPTCAKYEAEPGQFAPIHFWVKAPTYHFLGLIPVSHRLFGVEAPARLYLLGSDETGRDVFSRLLYGSRVSLTIGLIGILITTVIGLTVGGLAGYFGGVFDSVAMRGTELIMAIPGLYLIIALRAALAKYFDDSDQIFILIVVILSFIGWAGTARVIRGLTLSLRNRPFIYAAEALGQGPVTILWKHLFPNLFSYLIVTSMLSIPGYILGEAALSFLGIGIQEPSTSWGLMLSQVQDLKVFMLNFWWLLTPGLAIFITVILFNVLGDVVRDIVDPKLKTQV